MKSKLLALLLLLPLPAFAEAGWDNGFYIKSADGNFKMDIGGRLQVQEVTQIRRGSQVTTPGVARTASDNFSDTFKIRRARLQTSGTLYEKLDWVTILNVSTANVGGTANTTWYAWFTYNFHPAFLLTGGMVQLPLDRMGENSSSWLLGVEPPLTATQEDGLKDITIARNSLSMPLDLGLRIDGDIGEHFSYALAGANGNGFSNTNANNELSYGFMTLIHVLDKVPFKETDFENSENPKLTFNLGTGFEDEDAADANTPTVTRRWSWISAVGGAFRWRGFSLNSELYYRVLRLSATTVEDTNNDRRLRDTGYYGNAGYFFIPKKLEGMLTVSQLFREGADNNSNEFGGGLNYYIHDNKVKMQFDYTNVLDYDDIAGLNNATYHRFRLMFSMFI
ncbi:MAG: hypothetical protein HY466_02170 [Deltaproteobacteria bacterium]|nr:hypothetical protein [Deltaproteobacteria bacterium]